MLFKKNVQTEPSYETLPKQISNLDQSRIATIELRRGETPDLSDKPRTTRDEDEGS